MVTTKPHPLLRFFKKKKIVCSSFPVTAVAWEPLHMNPYCVRMASASKDATVIVWDTRKCQMIYALSSHTMSVTCIRWGGQNLLFTGSQDRTIKVKIISLSNRRSRQLKSEKKKKSTKVWEVNEGKLCRTLDGHAHWVNSLTLNTDYVLRTGYYDHTGVKYDKEDEGESILGQ